MLGLRETPVGIVLPILVIDELDNLKRSCGRDARWRPAYTLAFLDRILDSNTGYGTVRDEGYAAVDHGEIPRGRVTAEIALDPPGHSRLSINVAELVDRALTIQAVAGRQLTLVTYDTGQSTRARMAGLRVHKLRDDPGPEPTPSHQRNSDSRQEVAPCRSIRNNSTLIADRGQGVVTASSQPAYLLTGIASATSPGWPLAGTAQRLPAAGQGCGWWRCRWRPAPASSGLSGRGHELWEGPMPPLVVDPDRPLLHRPEVGPKP
jgi:hypothetical protein